MPAHRRGGGGDRYAGGGDPPTQMGNVDLRAGELQVIKAKNKEFRIVPLAQALQVMLEAKNSRIEVTPYRAGLRGG
tara:strand:+ start:1032 stop:1259 length:228 start_codon:yes stop_codon:yes gene_type:complete